MLFAGGVRKGKTYMRDKSPLTEGFANGMPRKPIHAPVRCANERRGIYMDLGMRNRSHVWWSRTAEPKLWYARVGYPSHGEDPQEDQRGTDMQTWLSIQAV